MIKKNDWEQAIYSQSACNLSGLAHSLHKSLVAKLRDVGVTDKDMARHPIVRLYVSQMAHLSHGTQDLSRFDPPILTDAETVPVLVQALSDAVAKAWEAARRQNKGTEYVNTYTLVKALVLKLAHRCFRGGDTSDWRWSHAYYRAHIYADRNPYSNSEPLTLEMADRYLKQYDDEERQREADEERRQGEQTVRLIEAEEEGIDLEEQGIDLEEQERRETGGGSKEYLKYDDPLGHDHSMDG